MEGIQTEADTKFTSKEFQEGLSDCGVWISLVSLYDQKINGEVEVTWKH